MKNSVQKPNLASLRVGIDLVPCAALVHFKHLGTPLVGMNF